MIISLSFFLLVVYFVLYSLNKCITICSAIYMCNLFTFIVFLFSIVIGLDQNIASLRFSTQA